MLVCGGRKYGVLPPPWEDHKQALKEQAFLIGYMDAIAKRCTIDCVIQGAAKGADTLAGKWALSRNIPVEEYPADWTKYGKRAGFLRNKQMLDEGKPTLVVAFPGGSGTEDMIRQSKAAGVPVLEVKI